MIDFESLSRMYSFSKSLTLKDINALIRASKRKSFHKKEIVINIDSASHEVYFIRKGLVRAYRINEKGEEITIALYPENSVLTNVDVFLFEEKSTYYYETLEKTKTFSIQYPTALEVLNRNPNLAQNKEQIFLRFLRSMFRRIESFVMYTPEERYLAYLKEYPSLSNRVPDKIIASVLGITPVSLSRIRKRIAEK